MLLVTAILAAACALLPKALGAEPSQCADEMGMLQARKNAAEFVNLTEGEPGTVAGLYTFGAPGPASPGFVNSAPGRCFPGARLVTQRVDENGMAHTDPVTWLTSAVRLWHPRMDLYVLDVEDPSKDRYHPCTEADVDRLPRARTFRLGEDSLLRQLFRADFDLHAGVLFDKVAARASNLMLRELSNWARELSYTRDAEEGAAVARGAGWRVIGAARYNSGDSTWLWRHGTQVSYLVQQPGTLECLITFQGTYDLADWFNNLRKVTTSFCGLTLRGMNCCPGGLPTCPIDCQTSRDGDSFVHSGWRAELRRMTEHPSWQKNVRPRLPHCKSVSVFGHSLGGAMSSLFAACIARAPTPGSFGFEDYNTLSWQKGTPTLLPENATFAT